MLRIIRQSYIAKGICLLLSLSFFIDLIHPLQLLALTGGPSQPEVESFTPVGSNDLVDLFSGDFKYSIPLMTVPGPNGGYPITIGYNGNAGMDQEASWVGLGWNLNPGCITRQMRGLPDDFNGNEIKKTFNKRSNNTYGIFIDDVNCEILGLDFFKSMSASAQLYYNTYKGLGINFGLGVSTVDKHSFNDGFATSLGIGFDSQGGISPNLSFKGSGEKEGINGSLGLSYNSRQGLLSMNTGLNKIASNGSRLSGANWGCTFGAATYVPPITIPLSGGSYRLSGKLGTTVTGAFADASVGVSFSTQKVKENSMLAPAYGVMYLENSDENSLKDFNREKDAIVNKNSKNLPIPIMTHDIFSVSGEGTGGVFRAFRSDIGYMSDPVIDQNFDGGQLGVDLGVGAGGHVGANIEVNLANSYSGIWQDGYDNSIFGFKSILSNLSPQTKVEEYEPFYFKMTNELTSSNPDHLDYVNGYQPIRFDAYKGADKLPQIDNKVEGQLSSKNINYSTRTARERRDKLIQYWTYAEFGTCPSGVNNTQLSQIDIVNPDGTTYVYGLPVYNNVQRDVYFSVESDTLNSWDNTISYSSDDASIQNKKGQDHLYSCTETPAYAYSFMLTMIAYPNFIDVNEDHQADTNDLGDYVSFKYSKPQTSYKWRVPYKDSFYNANYESDPNDDKANYTYGEKEICYISRIETRTHYAKFYTSRRKDCVAAADEFNVGAVVVDSVNGGYQMRLDSISLFAWGDTTTPIQTVHFVYTYELCKGIYNNIYYGIESKSGSSGKLTLKEIWFSYGNNYKGKFSPYNFDYHSNISSENPNYNGSLQDRWGNYNPYVLPSVPYVNQLDGNLDTYSGAWLLKEITLPSGGTIKIEYESDDYAYVQDKAATEMVRIAGIGVPDNERFVRNDSVDFNNRRVYFYLEPGCDIQDYISELDDGLVYFKVNMELKWGHSNYVEGYAEIETDLSSTGKGVNSNGDSVGFITLKESNVKNNANPMRVAGWQYMKFQRPDLIYPATSEDNALMQVVNVIVSLFNDLASLITGYYSYCIVSNYAPRIAVCPQKDLYPGSVLPPSCNATAVFRPSLIRLNTPDKIKKGGGSRVKNISLSDNWDYGTPTTYTEKYSYTINEAGKIISSGVAEYEPMIGGEEIALRYPVRYSSENSFTKHQELYLESPFGENYFPSPNVGYSRVVVETEYPQGVSKSASGPRETRFYTAKDFPVITKRTTIDDGAKYKPFPIQIPLIGYKSFASQGYT